MTVKFEAAAFIMLFNKILEEHKMEHLEHFIHIATYCIAEIALLITLIKVINDSDIIPGAFSLILSISLGICSFLYGLKIIVLLKEYGVFSLMKLPFMKLIIILMLASVAVIIIIRFILLIRHWRQLNR